MDMPVRVLGSVRVLALFGIHYQNCTKLQGTNSHKLPDLVMRPKEDVHYTSTGINFMSFRVKFLHITGTGTI
jgi:hypothetical protein